MKVITSFFGGWTIVKLSGSYKRKENNSDWLKKTIRVFFFFSFPIGFIASIALQRECQISLKRRKFYWKKCILEFRKCGIKNCEWSKIPEKCVIKECEWWVWIRKCIIKECEFWAKFTFFNSAFFCSADFSGVFVLDFK